MTPERKFGTLTRYETNGPILKTFQTCSIWVDEK